MGSGLRPSAASAVARWIFCRWPRRLRPRRFRLGAIKQSSRWLLPRPTGLLRRRLQGRMRQHFASRGGSNAEMATAAGAATDVAPLPVDVQQEGMAFAAAAAQSATAPTGVVGASWPPARRHGEDATGHKGGQSRAISFFGSALPQALCFRRGGPPRRRVRNGRGRRHGTRLCDGKVNMSPTQLPACRPFLYVVGGRETRWRQPCWRGVAAQVGSGAHLGSLSGCKAEMPLPAETARDASQPPTRWRAIKLLAAAAAVCPAAAPAAGLGAGTLCLPWRWRGADARHHGSGRRRATAACLLQVGEKVVGSHRLGKASGGGGSGGVGSAYCQPRRP